MLDVIKGSPIAMGRGQDSGLGGITKIFALRWGSEASGIFFEKIDAFLSRLFFSILKF